MQLMPVFSLRFFLHMQKAHVFFVLHMQKAHATISTRQGHFQKTCAQAHTTCPVSDCFTLVLSPDCLCRFTFTSSVMILEIHPCIGSTVKFLNFRTQETCCNSPKIQTKRLHLKVFHQKHANGIANSEDPDQTAPLGAV